MRPNRTLAIEPLERRELMSVSPIAKTTIAATEPAEIVPAIMAAVQSAAPKASSQATDKIFKVDVQLGGGILSQITNLASELRTMDKAIESILGEIPGWHLTADIDKTPHFSGHVTGMIDEAPNGALKSASLGLTVSADVSATIEGYYGISILHVGIGATADLSESMTATANFSTSHGWAFGGSVTASGSLTGFAEATLAIWKGELYAQGNITSTLAINNSGIVSGNLVLSASVGADIQQYSLPKKQWLVYLDQSYSLGKKSYSCSFTAVSLFQKGVDQVMSGIVV